MARLILLALLCLPLAAHADPISLVATLAPIVGSSAAGFIVSYGGYIAFGALQLVGAANARRKQRRAAARQRDAYNASLQDRSVTVASADAPWQIVYGSPAPVGGSIVAILTSGDRDQLKHLVIVYAAHECQAIDEIYIDGVPVGPLDASGWCTGGEFYEVISGESASELVTLDGAGVGTVAHTISSILTVTTVTVGDDDRPIIVEYNATASGSTITAPAAAGQSVIVTYNYVNGTPRVNIQKHLSPGGVDTADAYLVAACPDKWTAAHKLSGFTYIVLTLDLDMARFQGGPPNATAKLRGKKLYDQRTSTTAFSANGALCVADYLASDYGYGSGTALIDATAVIAAANGCDAQAFSCSGVISTGQDRDSNLQALEDSMAGGTHFSGGVWRIMAGAWSTPVMTLTEADLAGRIEVVQASEPADKRYVGARGTYVPAGGLGVPADITPYGVVSTVPGVLDMQFPFTGTNAECGKLAGIAVERSKLGETIIFPAHLSAWKLQPGDRTAVNNAELGYVGKTFRVVDWAFSASAPVGLVMTEDTAAVWTGTSIATEPVDATSNLANPYARPAAPTGLTAASGTDQLIVNGDGTITTRVLVQWSAPTSRAVLQGGGAQLQWRLATATDEFWQSTTLPPDTTSRILTGVEDGTVIVVRVRHINGLTVAGDWANLAHRVLGKSEPPPDVETFLIDGSRLSWTYPSPPPDHAGFEIRFNYGVNTWWDGAAKLHEGLVTDNPYVMVRRPAGQVTILIKAVDTSGNYSANAAAIVADLGDQIVSNLLLSWPQAPTFNGGTISGGSVSGGTLQATATDLFYGPDTEPFYGTDTSVFYDAGTYADMSYTWPVAMTDFGTLLLDHDITGSNYLIEYQRDSQAAFYGADADLFYGASADAFYDLSAAWAVWPGSLEITSHETITFRISTVGGAVQGVVTVATPKLDVPDVVERISDLVVSALGTRLPISQSYRAIANVLLTVQTDGNGGVSAIADDKNETLGPLVHVVNAAGTNVAGLIDATVQGY